MLANTNDAIPVDDREWTWSAKDEAIDWVQRQFPYTVRPSTNEGAGHAIFEWLNSNIGQMDVRWTYLGSDVRFRSEDDQVLYILTWQR